MPPSRSSTASGFTLIELLVSLALGAAALAGLGALFTSTQRYKAAADREISLQRLDLLLAAELNSLLNGYDSQPLHIPPIIHDRGDIRLFSGEPNRVHRSQERLRPPPDSRAVSVLLPDFNARLRVRAHPRSFGAIRGCAPDGREVPFAEFRTALAVTLDGISELRILSAGEEPGGCRVLRARGSESAHFPALAADELPYIRLIIPIRQEFTLYLGRGGELRYLGHAGAENIENQPIASQLEKFLPARLETPDPFLLGLNFSVALRGREISRSGLSRFSKRNYADILLNEP